MNPIEFETGGEKYRFNRLNRQNMIIEKLCTVAKKDGSTEFEWKRVSGYHSALSIRRELVELIGADNSGTLEGYYRGILARLTEISEQLDALLPAIGIQSDAQGRQTDRESVAEN